MKRSRALELLLAWHERHWTQDEWDEVSLLPNPHSGKTLHAAVVVAAGVDWHEWLNPTPERRLKLRAAWAAALAEEGSER